MKAYLLASLELVFSHRKVSALFGVMNLIRMFCIWSHEFNKDVLYRDNVIISSIENHGIQLLQSYSLP